MILDFIKIVNENYSLNSFVNKGFIFNYLIIYISKFFEKN